MGLAERRFAVALILSACVHALLVWSLSRAAEPSLEKPQEITVVYAGPSEAAGGGAKTGETPAPEKRKSRRHKAKVNPADIPLSALTPKWSMEPKEQNFTDDSDRSADETVAWKDTYAYDQIGLSDYEGLSAGQAGFIGALWNMINQYIEENPFLSEYNRAGRVFLRFEIDESGHLERRSFVASANDRVLKVIAARAVRRAIKNERGDITFTGERMVINARFVWTGYQACNNLRGFRGSYLSFCHYGENKAKTFTTAEKVGTYAGEIWNHGPWAYEEIQKYRAEERRRRSDFDPFEEYKRDPDWNL
jgi:hypothetical protein